MITLYKFGSNFNLPDPSPFVMKAEILLKMAELPYEVNTEGNVTKAPKKKFPYIFDNGKIIADTSLIRFYLEETYHINFDKEADLNSLPSAFLAEKYCEDNLYFVVLGERWLNKENFDKGPIKYFQQVPWLMRSLVSNKVRKDVEQTLWLQGLGRHTQEEKILLVKHGSSMLSKLLGDRNFYGGDSPCGSDAFIASLFCSIMNDYFDDPFRQYFIQQSNLVNYTKRMMQLFYPAYQPNF